MLKPLLTSSLLVLSSFGWVPTAHGQEGLEQVVVRNRLYPVAHTLELSVDASFSALSRLTSHDNFQAGIAYNLTEHWGLEARAGYAVSGHTGLADHLGADLLARDPAQENTVLDDLSGLWELKANGVVGVRWAPLYGKVSLLSDAAVRYQAYLWLGGGAALLHRQSVVYCGQVKSRSPAVCGAWLTQDRGAPVGSAALGLRFFTGHWGALRVELRNYVFRDQFLVNIDRSVAETGASTGQASRSPGLDNLMMLDVGISFFL